VMTPSAETTHLPSRSTFDVQGVRADFPILETLIGDHPLVYLDNAATSQKPRQVIDAERRYYESMNANIHRGVHRLSVRATQEYELVRKKAQQFVGADRTEEIVFVRGATEAINLVATSYGREHVGPGDEVLITHMEHHSNIVPWQMLCEQVGATLRVSPIGDDGGFLFDEFRKLLGPRTKIVAVTHVSNALGTMVPVQSVVEAAHDVGAVVLVDGAQAIPHVSVDVQALGCDFYTFSSHKMCGPTGVGVLFGRLDLLDPMPPYQGGGDMIKSVTFEKTTYNDVPHRFEAGTPNIAGGIGFGAAIDYLNEIGMDAIASYERELVDYGTAVLSEIPEVRLIGTAAEKASVISFVVRDIHPHDVGTVLDQEGIAVRTGHHCSQPVMQRFGVAATTRASVAFYNTKEELDKLAVALRRVIEVFR
jgi:cysteine desulfurase / selenocysteine lyase